ncbi:hypothetical protein GCM10009682_28060 [Luedemannella flava]|uniref:Uncharacterized protein n=1 Tax=Luedemannella flava TaxID=349316 RepID=A0ABN2M1G8_9ACTN
MPDLLYKCDYHDFVVVRAKQSGYTSFDVMITAILLAVLAAAAVPACHPPAERHDYPGAVADVAGHWPADHDDSPPALTEIASGPAGLMWPGPDHDDGCRSGQPVSAIHPDTSVGTTDLSRLPETPSDTQVVADDPALAARARPAGRHLLIMHRIART